MTETIPARIHLQAYTLMLVGDVWLIPSAYLVTELRLIVGKLLTLFLVFLFTVSIHVTTYEHVIVSCWDYKVTILNVCSDSGIK